MNIGRTVFSQLMDYVPAHIFRQAVKRHNGNLRVRRFSCWDQFVSMAFAQLTYRESLRDIASCLRSLGPKLYSSGIRHRVSRSTLADANELRSWHIYHDLALALIDRARTLYRNEAAFRELQSAVYAFDSTTIERCLTLFPWAHAAGHIKTCAAVKLHTLLDINTKIPTFVRISAANVHDMLMLDELIYEPGAFYVLDRGYMDFTRLKHIDASKAFFVIRAKQALHFTRINSNRVDKSSGLRVDQTTLAHQSFLRHQSQCCQNTNLDRCLYLCTCRHRQKRTQARTLTLHNSTNLERNSLSERIYFSSTYRFTTQYSNYVSR